jgi:hypothetical protein
MWRIVPALGAGGSGRAVDEAGAVTVGIGGFEVVVERSGTGPPPEVAWLHAAAVTRNGAARRRITSSAYPL